MTFKATLTLSAVFAASLALFPNTAFAQTNSDGNNSTQTQPRSYQPISDLSISSEIEKSVLAGEHDETLTQTYDVGVSQAFRAAYAINVMNPLWTESSAKDLFLAASAMQGQGVVGQDMLQEIEQAMENRFEGATAKKRAQGDMALSMTYIGLENLRHPEGSKTPRLADLDTHLFSAGQSGVVEADYTMNF